VIFSLTRNEPSQPQYPARLSSCLQTLRLRLPSHPCSHSALLAR